MWQFVVDFVSEWLSRPTGLANIGIVLGLTLFLFGVMQKNSRMKGLGLATVGFSLVAGIVQYVYG